MMLPRTMTAKSDRSLLEEVQYLTKLIESHRQPKAKVVGQQFSNSSSKQYGKKAKYKWNPNTSRPSTTQRHHKARNKVYKPSMKAQPPRPKAKSPSSVHSAPQHNGSPSRPVTYLPPVKIKAEPFSPPPPSSSALSVPWAPPVFIKTEPTSSFQYDISSETLAHTRTIKINKENPQLSQRNKLLRQELETYRNSDNSSQANNDHYQPHRSIVVQKSRTSSDSLRIVIENQSHDSRGNTGSHRTVIDNRSRDPGEPTSVQGPQNAGISGEGLNVKQEPKSKPKRRQSGKRGRKKTKMNPNPPPKGHYFPKRKQLKWRRKSSSSLPLLPPQVPLLSSTPTPPFFPAAPPHQSLLPPPPLFPPTTSLLTATNPHLMPLPPHLHQTATPLLSQVAPFSSTRLPSGGPVRPASRHRKRRRRSLKKASGGRRRFKNKVWVPPCIETNENATPSHSETETVPTKPGSPENIRPLVGHEKKTKHGNKQWVVNGFSPVKAVVQKSLGTKRSPYMVSMSGRHYAMDPSRKRLKRLSSSLQAATNLSPVVSRYLGKARDTYAKRLMASRVIRKSKAYVWHAKMKNKSKQYCLFFNRLGKCNRGKDCPYIHDPERVAVCTKFLRGSCDQTDGKCPFSHKISKEKMPVCSFFLRGICTKDDCPYLHVSVGTSAEVCPDFIKGYCSLGEKCTLQHIRDCPKFFLTGTCPEGSKCKLRHKKRMRKLQRTPAQRLVSKVKEPSAFKRIRQKQEAIASRHSEKGPGGDRGNEDTKEEVEGEEEVGSVPVLIARELDFLSLDINAAPDFIPL